MRPTSFQHLQEIIPLIPSCLKNPELAKEQKIYHLFALNAVVELLQLKEEASYSWNPEASCREYAITGDILKALKEPSTTPLTASHVFSYLNLNKL